MNVRTMLTRPVRSGTARPRRLDQPDESIPLNRHHEAGNSAFPVLLGRRRCAEVMATGGRTNPDSHARFSGHERELVHVDQPAEVRSKPAVRLVKAVADANRLDVEDNGRFGEHRGDQLHLYRPA